MFEKLVNIIVNYVEVNKEDIKPESRFMEDLGFTSYDFMSMLGEIEDELDVEIEEEEAANIRTVQEAVDYLKKLSEQEGVNMDVLSSTIRELLVKSEAAYGSWDAFRYKVKQKGGKRKNRKQKY